MRHMPATILVFLTISARNINAKCSTSEECSLNGDCVNAECVCDAAWTGATCDVLAIEAADRLSGYHNKVHGAYKLEV